MASSTWTKAKHIFLSAVTAASIKLDLLSFPVRMRGAADAETHWYL